MSWHLNILAEEVQGLTHTHEDVKTMSAPDNYWCAVFERAVKGNVKQSSNKGTFATAEAQREVLKPLGEPEKSIGSVNIEQV